jgi:hypothetical protein
MKRGSLRLEEYLKAHTEGDKIAFRNTAMT